jgi:hypothetical protein
LHLSEWDCFTECAPSVSFGGSSQGSQNSQYQPETALLPLPYCSVRDDRSTSHACRGEDAAAPAAAAAATAAAATAAAAAGTGRPTTTKTTTTEHGGCGRTDPAGCFSSSSRSSGCCGNSPLDDCDERVPPWRRYPPCRRLQQPPRHRTTFGRILRTVRCLRLFWRLHRRLLRRCTCWGPGRSG